MVTAEAHDRDLFSLLKKINIRGFFSHKNLFDDGDRFDIAGSCSEKNAIPLYFIRRDYGRLVSDLPIAKHDFGLREEEIFHRFLRIRMCQVDFLGLINLAKGRNPFRQLNWME